MIDLVYPENAAPLADGAAFSKSEEMMPIVDASGMVIAQAPREFCHSSKNLLHPVVHLYLVDTSGRIYLQKRAGTKNVFPLHWDCSAGGHISYGESVKEALFREAREELGLRDFNPVFLETSVWEGECERELVYTFASVGNFNPVPDPDEIQEGKWWSSYHICRSREAFTPCFTGEFQRLRNTLSSLL